MAEARRLNHLGHPGDTRLWARIAERLADGSAAPDDRVGPEELLRAELAEERAYRLRQKDEDAESGAELETAAGLYEELGMEWRALAARARALAWTTGEDDADAERDEAVRVRLGRLVREAERLKDEAPLTGEKPGDAEAAAGVDVASDRVLAHLTVLYADAYTAYQEAMRREPEESGAAPERFREAVGRLRAEAERLGVPHQVANARQFVADEAGRRGDVALAESELRAALVDVEASDRPWRASRPRALLAQIMLSRQEPAEAAELLHRALADAVRYDDADFPMAPTYSLLGHASSHLGDHAGRCATSRRRPRCSTGAGSTRTPPAYGSNWPTCSRSRGGRRTPWRSWSRCSPRSRPPRWTSGWWPRSGCPWRAGCGSWRSTCRRRRSSCGSRARSPGGRTTPRSAPW